MTIWTIGKTINTPIKPERDTHDMIGAFRPEVIDFLIGAVLDNREMLSIWTCVRVAWVRRSRSGWWSILLRVQRQDAQANWWCWWVSYKKGLFLIASSIRMDIILNNVLDVSEFKHYRINHSKLFADKQNHINGNENFWDQAKRHMRRFNGIPAKHFPLFLKECEWRFNNPNPKAQ